MAIRDAKYVSTTTYRKSGAAVATPTWIVALDGSRLGFWTSSASGEYKRLRSSPRITLQPSDSRGRDYSAANGIGFIPFFPLATGNLAKPGGPLAELAGPLAELAGKHGATPSQLALAWLLHRSPVVLPIPGTSSVTHLEENVTAAGIALSDGEYAALEAAAK